MGALSTQETQELRRILAAFKAELPPHDLGWFITKHPDESLLEDTTGYNWACEPLSMRWDDWFTVKGYAVCTRCGTRFDITHPFHTKEDGLSETVTKAKEHVSSRALQGPCWGDVPESTENGYEPSAVLDSVAAMREP